MRLAAWRRRMKLWAILLSVLGLAALLGGAVWLGKGSSLGGFLLGSAGVLGLVFGALCARLAAAGPFPKDVEP